MYLKFCGFKQRDDVLFAKNLGVNAVGFITFPKSQRYVTNDEIDRMTKNIDDIDLVAIMVNPYHEEIENIIKETAINTIQFHGDESREFIKKVKNNYPEIKLIKALPANDDLNQQIKEYQDIVSFLIIDTPSSNYGGSGEMFDWNLLEALKNINYLIAGGLNKDRIQTLLKQRGEEIGYDLSSGIETKGKKDITKMKAIIELMEEYN